MRLNRNEIRGINYWMRSWWADDDDDDVDGVDRCKLLASIEAICYGVSFTSGTLKISIPIVSIYANTSRIRWEKRDDLFVQSTVTIFHVSSSAIA